MHDVPEGKLGEDRGVIFGELERAADARAPRSDLFRCVRTDRFGEESGLSEPRAGRLFSLLPLRISLTFMSIDVIKVAQR